MNNIIKIHILILSSLLILTTIKAQNIDTIPKTPDTTNPTNLSNPDSLLQDSLPLDSLSLSNDTINTENKDAIPYIVDFQAEDSMRISIQDEKIILYGKGKITTPEMELNADSVGVNISNKEIEAAGLTDSTHKKINPPIFKEGEQEYSSDSMRYNFDTKKGLAYGVITNEDEGYLHGEIIKIHNTDEMHIFQGKYTTCNHPHPHYYIDLTKAKLKNKDKLITGPLYFVIQDIPVPIIIPFGFFPLSQKNSSGIHLPTYADEIDRGFGLVGLGYFWAINDYINLDITGDIYSKGSWGMNIKTNMKKRYKYTLGLNLNFFHYQNGEKILKTTKISNSYNLQLSYRQDQKANPTSNFSATINYVRGNIQQYNATDINQFVNTNASSSIAYQKNFQGTPFRMSLNGNLNQNSKDSIYSLNFPTMNLSMAKIFPFKPKKKPATGAWYEKIGLSFNSALTNSVTAHDSVFFKHQDSLVKIMKSGFKYDIPLQLSLTILKYFTITPSVNYTGRIYPKKIVKTMNGQPDSLYPMKNTIWGFNHVYDFSTGANMSTKIFGTFRLNLGRLKAIRHVISPSISYRYTPDFASNFWGYYAEDPENTKQKYSYYANEIYGTPAAGEKQMLSLSIRNNFEAKIGNNGDTTKQEKKIRLIDNLATHCSYNFAADSLKLSYIAISGSLQPFDKINISFSSRFDPYILNKNGQRINKFELKTNKKLARFENADLTIGTQIANTDFNKDKKKKKTNITWNTNISYSFRYNKKFNTQTKKFDTEISQTASVDFNIEPTKLWRVSIRSGYDFDVNEVTSTTFSIYRDLHCWEMGLQITPFGLMRSYMFKINIKAAMFQAIKFERKRSWHDN